MLVIALAIDLALGEPPPAVHPVVWMGRVISFLEKGNISRRPAVQFAGGCMITVTTIGLFTVPAYFLLVYLEGVSFAAYLVVGGALLKSTFSIKELRCAALEIRRYLTNDRLDRARFELRALVKRDTHSLPSPLLVSATVESVAENTCDSFVAPLFYFLFLGVPGAVGYRVVNTLDSMIGYHGKYEYLGKFASRLDDVLNFIPARLSALFLVFATFLTKGNGSSSWRVMLSDHSRTESPNAGWTMAAAAGALDVQLEKVDHYKLGIARVRLVPETIDAAVKLALVAMLSWGATCITIGVIRLVVTA